MNGIGQYEFVRFIGSGSFAGVWECRYLATGESFAAKIISVSDVIKNEYYPHFKNELLIHSRIRHPNISQLKDVLIDRDNIYIVLELCDGGDLNEIVQSENGLNEESAKHYFYQIMGAISHIHRLGVAHRDIKLDNILITSDDDAKLTDFGLCKEQKGDNPMLTTCGTLVYASPEIIRQEPYNGMKTDIWSAGVVLYAMIANHFPWSVDPDLPPELLMAETAKQIVSGEIELPEGISFHLQNLIGNLLNVDPEERPSAEDVLMHPWFEGTEIAESEDNEPDPDIIGLVESLIQVLEEQRQALNSQ